MKLLISWFDVAVFFFRVLGLSVLARYHTIMAELKHLNKTEPIGYKDFWEAESSPQEC